MDLSRYRKFNDEEALKFGKRYYDNFIDKKL